MTDPQWSIEFSLQDNRTKARREIRIESPELVGAFLGAVQGMAAVVGGEARVMIDEAFRGLPPEFRVKRGALDEEGRPGG